MISTAHLSLEDTGGSGRTSAAPFPALRNVVFEESTPKVDVLNVSKLGIWLVVKTLLGRVSDCLYSKQKLNTKWAFVQITVSSLLFAGVCFDPAACSRSVRGSALDRHSCHCGISCR